MCRDAFRHHFPDDLRLVKHPGMPLKVNLFFKQSNDVDNELFKNSPLLKALPATLTPISDTHKEDKSGRDKIRINIL